MKHPHRIREIAERAGLSQATVDRVLHDRGGVRESTARRVHRAIAALDQREPPFEHTVAIDVVVPRQRQVRAALAAELPGLLPIVVRPRFAADLSRVARSRARGLILDAPDTPEVVEAVGRLDIPVVTLGSDLPASKRVAHVGGDEAEAGATAAYLVEQLLADRAGDVLIVGEAARGFHAEMRSRAPHRRLLAAGTGEVRQALAANPAVRAVYSTAAGDENTAVVEAFAAERRKYDVFVAHDLDAANTGLLRQGKVSAVLHHDVRAQLRLACRALLKALGVLPGPVRDASSTVRVTTPMNIPG
ncbi:DNA-binding protein [Paractinoplanes deccanensis]|uniref:DNA-binding protein n=1 Tax=Paractinoplanes deccanensis TaxID=113561 RepID=A0ABQ3YJU2_9ACTN|nr:LacI family DNA-binding transcriptional regulator [Actinoplanes deccanensis]GID80268.1 DNA-binding protein [Actinoplanes deccanensis]